MLRRRYCAPALSLLLPLAPLSENAEYQLFLKSPASHSRMCVDAKRAGQGFRNNSCTGQNNLREPTG